METTATYLFVRVYITGVKSVTATIAGLEPVRKTIACLMCWFSDFDGSGREAVAYTEDLRGLSLEMLTIPPYINTREDRTVPIQLR